ncbi:MAG: citrulline utilization hydrolase CtlX [Chitinophagales bacterium]
MQTTSNILMIRPVKFGFNPETAVNNAFQVAQAGGNAQENAFREFNDFVDLLKENGVDVTVIDDSPLPHTPDSIFPNNWVSFHDNGTVCLYPMYATNRRRERKPEVLEKISQRFNISKTIDLSYFEGNNLYLEGTGSMVLDRDNRIAYACISPRTNRKLLDIFCAQMEYKPVAFEAEDQNGRTIYHTNVMMCVADQYVVICLDSVIKKDEKSLLAISIKNSGKEIIEISLAQMNHFAGNMLQVENRNGKKILVMSSQAYDSLTEKQIRKLNAFNPIIHSKLNTLEANGGGSARCMMAEIHLPEKVQ